MPSIQISSSAGALLPTPVSVAIPPAMELPVSPLQLRELHSGTALPCQVVDDRLVFLVSGLPPDQQRTYLIEPGPARTGIRLEQGRDALAIHLPEGRLTCYYHGARLARPFLYPLVGPPGHGLTRAFPLLALDEEAEAGDLKHPHHRSLWSAYGEVNGSDNWTELAGHGRTKHVRFAKQFEGPAVGGFAASGVWLAHDGSPLLDELREVRVYNAGPDVRLMDYDLTLRASYADVEYGDTKEGGVLALRLFHAMRGASGGRMVNSRGASGQEQCWGQRAEWLDCSGTVHGHAVGVVIMDHPSNPNHPCRWHARDYGLIATNPFADAAFDNAATSAPFRQEKGEALAFRYRLYLHRGDASQADARGAYQAWVTPPACTVFV